MRAIRTALVVATGVGLVAGVAGCSQQASDDHQHGTTAVVASTNVWGSVVSAVTGEHATVKSIIDNAADDPHSYEVTPADAAGTVQFTDGGTALGSPVTVTGPISLVMPSSRSSTSGD